MDHVTIASKLHPNNPLSSQLKAIGSRAIRERLSEAVTLRQKNRTIKKVLQHTEQEDEETEEMVIGAMHSKWKANGMSTAVDGPYSWSPSLNGVQNGGDFQDQPLDFSSKTRKRRFSSSSSVEEATKVSSKYGARYPVSDIVARVKTEEELISTTSWVKPSMVSSVEDDQKRRLKQQYLQLLRPESSPRPSVGPFFPARRPASHDAQPEVALGMSGQTSGLAGMAQFNGLPLTSDSGSVHHYEGADPSRVARPFKSYVRDTFRPTSAAATLPLGYYGLPSQLPFMSMHFQGTGGNDPSIDSLPSSLMDLTYSTESYAEFRRQVLSLHQTINGSTKRSPTDNSVQSFNLHPRPMDKYGRHSHGHDDPVECSERPLAPPSPMLNPAFSPSSCSSSVSPASSPTRQNRKVNPSATSGGGSSGESTEQTTTNVACPSPTSSCTSSSELKAHGLVPTTNTFASSGSFSDNVHHLHHSMNGSTSSTSSVEGVRGDDLPCKRRGRSLPEELKDEAYWERRRKNNEAAKRSRDARRAKEDEIAIRAAFLEQENLKLRVEVASLKSETAKLRCLLYNS